MRKIHDVLTSEEIKDLCRKSDFKGWQAVGTTWAIIIFSLLLAGFYPSWLTIVVAMVMLGGRHLALAILMHECAHRSLFERKDLNQIVGHWLIAVPALQRLSEYRDHHMAHHNHVWTDADPDKSLVEHLPMTASSFSRKVLRDLVGITGLKRLYGVCMMDMNMIQYTVSADVIPLKNNDTWADRCALLVAAWLPRLIVHLVLLCFLMILDIGWTYSLWVLSYMTTFSLFIRIRSLAEHGNIRDIKNPWLNTRTTRASWLARTTVAPHYVNYHLEHHLLMTVPCYHLPKMHRLIRSRVPLSEIAYAPNYRSVLRGIRLAPENK